MRDVPSRAPSSRGGADSGDHPAGVAAGVGLRRAPRGLELLLVSAVMAVDGMSRRG